MRVVVSQLYEVRRRGGRLIRRCAVSVVSPRVGLRAVFFASAEVDTVHQNLRRAALCDTFNKVNFLLAGLLVLEIPVTDQRETCHGLAGIGSPQIRVADEAALDCNLI